MVQWKVTKVVDARSIERCPTLLSVSIDHSALLLLTPESGPTQFLVRHNSPTKRFKQVQDMSVELVYADRTSGRTVRSNLSENRDRQWS